MKLLDICTSLTPFPSYFTPDLKSEMQLCLYNIWDTGLAKHGNLFKKFTMKNEIIDNGSVLHLHLKAEHSWSTCCVSVDVNQSTPVPLHLQDGHFTQLSQNKGDISLSSLKMKTI